MKPKRPTETELLAVVQNGFQDQIRLDREPPMAQENHGPARAKETQPPSPVPHVRVTLAIPEELRYRIKLSVMDQRRKGQPRLTQDEFCAEALRLHLESQDRNSQAIDALEKVRAFLKGFIQAKGYPRSRTTEATAMVEIIEKVLGPVSGWHPLRSGPPFPNE